jgi:hypothetical protein
LESCGSGCFTFRWKRALNEAAHRCEVFLVSRAWLSSGWCLKEFNLAQRLHKRLFGVLIEDGIPFADLPKNLTSTWQTSSLVTKTVIEFGAGLIG